MKTLLVAVDGSPRSRGVLDAALALGGADGAKLVLVRAVSLGTDLPSAAFRLSPNEVADLVRDDATKELAVFEASIPEPLRGGVRVELGTPWEVIERVAEREDADLIVLGSHGYSGLDRILGTTAAKVVNHATRSVLVVRAPERLGASGP